MIPKRIQSHFNITQQIMDRDSSIIEGMLTCCGAHDFGVFVVGKVKHTLFNKMFLYPDNDQTVFEVRCKKCGKIISVFNSSIDGYWQCEKNPSNIFVSTELVDCRKCRSESFSVTIKYEYPSAQELQELEITNIDNSFTWIWITLECNKCGTKYKNFVDLETT